MESLLLSSSLFFGALTYLLTAFVGPFVWLFGGIHKSYVCACQLWALCKFFWVLYISPLLYFIIVNFVSVLLNDQLQSMILCRMQSKKFVSLCNIPGWSDECILRWNVHLFTSLTTKMHIVSQINQQVLSKVKWQSNVFWTQLNLYWKLVKNFHWKWWWFGEDKQLNGEICFWTFPQRFWNYFQPKKLMQSFVSNSFSVVKLSEPKHCSGIFFSFLSKHSHLEH